MTLSTPLSGGDAGHLTDHDALHTVYNPTLDDNLIRYVTTFGSASNDGLTEATAFDDPQDAFDDVPEGGEVRIATGIYTTAVGYTCDTESLRIVGTGGLSSDEGSPYKGTHLQTTNDDAIAAFTFGTDTTLRQQGPTIENINFSQFDFGGNTNTGVLIHNANRWTLRNCTFRRGAAGLKLTRESGGDNAWGLVEQCTFRACVLGIDSDQSYGFVAVGGNFNNCTTYSIDLDAETQHARLVGVKMDNVGMRNQGEHTKLLGVTIESTDSPMLDIDHTTGRSGDDTSALGCTFIGSGSNTGILIDTDAEGTTLAGNTYLNVATEVTDNGVGSTLLDTVSRPTVSGARDVPEEALADLIAELATIGIITDSTTAT